MSDAHYRFPPAAAYALNRCLHAIKSDAAYCGRFAADPAGAMDELGLPAEERAALAPFDGDGLVARGAHPYLVFMADLRLRMAREPGTLEYF